MWYGLWGGGEDGGRKPCAVHFNMQREDYISYYTKGYTMHGEWFLNGKRLPRRPNGLDEPLAHLQELPSGELAKDGGAVRWTLVDAELEDPEFPALTDDLEITDGCAAQYEGRKNVGRVVMGRSRLGVTLHSVITVAKHGKCLADGLSNVPVSKINEGLQNGHHIGTGTRAHVLYLAQTHPGPLTAEENRVGAWAPGRYFYGHYADSLWSSSDQAMDFKPYKEAKKYRYRAGLVADKERAAVSGRFTGRRRFCACPPCAPPKFATGKCLVRHISAPPVALVCPTVRAPAGTKTRTQALTDFSRALKAGEVRAVVAADDEKALEGNFWLAELLSESYAIDEDVVLNGDHLKAGFLVVKVRWLSFQGKAWDLRRYSVGEESLVVTSALVRTAPVNMDSSGSFRVLSASDEQRIDAAI